MLCFVKEKVEITPLKFRRSLDNSLNYFHKNNSKLLIAKVQIILLSISWFKLAPKLYHLVQFTS
jgi:hypothetical protein